MEKKDYINLEDEIKNKCEFFKYVPDDEKILHDVCLILDQANARIGELQDASKQENPGIAEIWNKLINLADKVEEASQRADEHATEYSAVLAILASNGKAGEIFMNLCLNSGIHKIQRSLEKAMVNLKRIHKNYNWLLSRGPITKESGEV